ncbi:MAG: twin-arginine translocation signal domain-containing protein [Planctomycetaceae bacterium]|nr:twin-arginine translocation signal domain-containing protein [Planctomycetaceae bacterium]
MTRTTADHLSRRDFLAQSAIAGIGATWLASGVSPLWAAPAARPKVAAVVTEFTYRSHAHVILENFLKPYLFNGQLTDPGADVVSLYIDQFPAGEMGRGVSNEYQIPIYGTIDEALCRGGKELAVDAVLSIGEHGNYPHNEKGQHEYPRKRFFDEIVKVFRRSGRTAPVFSDKHLSYRWDWAKEMYDTSRELGFPLMAGSSVPLAQRTPPLEVAVGTPFVEAVSIHGGGVESYDFHCLEVLQSLVEFRSGGESGVAEVQFLEGADVWKAAAAGRWSIPLAEAAMQAEYDREQPGTKLPPLKQLVKELKGDENSLHGILLSYNDGFRAAALTVGSSSTRWNFAGTVQGKSEPLATSFYVGPWQNRNLFKALSHAIQTHFREKKAPYPVERTLLVTGILDAEMQSRFEKGTVQKTPQLKIAYQPQDFLAMREMGESWKIITEQTPEPMGINPNGGAVAG